MTWLLMITLLSGLSGPVQMEEALCKATALAVQSGQSVFVELQSGAVELVVKAECKMQEVGA